MRAVLVVAAIALGGLVLFSSLGGDEKSFDLVAPTGERSVVDVGEDGVSLGDMTVFSGSLEDDEGRIDGVCTITSAPEDEAEHRQRCEVTLTLDDGETELQLASVGRVEADDVIFSIVGGGGEYAGAGGDATFDYTDPDRTRIEVSLDD
jgi:ATP-dependent protease HslVU (ClpYQ) peptidase subunit